MSTVFIEPKTLDTCVAITATATAQDVLVNGRTFILQNTSADKVLYFKEKGGAAATSANAMVLAAGATFPFQLTAGTLSVISTATCTAILAYLK